MTDDKGTPGLPETELETYIILPFQIARGGHKGGFDAEEFREYLGTSIFWDRATAIHEPDLIACQGLGDSNKPTLDRIRYQAYNYFHPFVRSFWYDSTLVQRFRHRGVKMLRTSFYDWRRGQAQTVDFDAVADLYHFLPDIGVLVLHLKARGKLSLPHAQECLDRLRRIYPPYIGGGGSFGGHFPDKVELYGADGRVLDQYANDQIEGLIEKALDCEKSQKSGTGQDDINALKAHGHILATHWAALLKPLGEGGSYQVLQLGDDRAALVSKVNLFPDEGIPLVKCVDRGNMIRLCFADASGTDHLPYAQRYLRGFERRFCYDRFWYLDGESGDKPSRIMNSGYAFTWLGTEDKDYFTNEFDGAPVAFRHIYVPMAIIAHFQKAALLVASRRLADLSPYGVDGKPQELSSEVFKAMEAHFIAFTQTYWFDEITPQEQGSELYEMWRRELHLPRLYQALRQELQDIVAFVNGREEARQTKSANNLNWFALVFALIGVALAFIGILTGLTGMNLLPSETDEATKVNPELVRMSVDAFEWLSYLWPVTQIAMVMAMALLVAIPIAQMSYRYMAARSKTTK